MKRSAVVLGVVLLAATAGAQSKSSDAQLPAAPWHADTLVLNSETTQTPSLWADAAPADPVTIAASPIPASSDPAAAQMPPVYGVRPGYSWQFYAGYTFFNFYEVPNLTNLENGFDVGLTYYPHAGWIGAEGDLQSTFGYQAGCTSKFVLASGGLRLRWAASRGVQFFLHGLGGGAHFFPQTAFGSQNAFGYEAGGGVDVTRGYRRMGFRGEVDAVGTRFFGTYQYSPKVTIGVFFNF